MKGDIMAKIMLFIFTLITINGCGEKKVDLSPKVNDEHTTVTTERTASTHNVPEVIMESDFVPPHIANSTIEVVPH